MLGFFEGLYYRTCCESCPFANLNRVSDITIGDFWGLNKIKKQYDPNKGISLCIINTDKGNKILKKLKNYSDISEEDSKIAIENNKNLMKPSKLSLKRDDFYKELVESKNFSKSINKYVKKKSKLYYIITTNMNDDLKNKIKRMIRGNLNEN